MARMRVVCEACGKRFRVPADTPPADLRCTCGGPLRDPTPTAAGRVTDRIAAGLVYAGAGAILGLLVCFPLSKRTPWWAGPAVGATLGAVGGEAMVGAMMGRAFGRRR